VGRLRGEAERRSRLFSGTGVDSEWRSSSKKDGIPLTYRIVAFGSPQWVELEKHTEPVLTNKEHKEFKRSACAANRPTQREGETLVEYVSRLLEAYGVSQPTLTGEENWYSHVARKAVRVRIYDFVGFVLDWLNRWETRELERMHALQVPGAAGSRSGSVRGALSSMKRQAVVERISSLKLIDQQKS